MKTFTVALVLLMYVGLHQLTAQNNIADKAVEQMKNGAYAQAIESWSRAISLEATNDLFYFKRGQCNLKINRLNNALLDFNKAVEYAPENAEYLFYQGFAYFEQGDYGNAKWGFENALKRDAQNVEYFLYKIKNLSALEQYRAAIEDCRKMLRVSENPEILVQRALLYQRQGDHELAERDIKQAQKTDFESARYQASLGLYFKNEKDFAQAIRAYSKAHELEKTNVHYIYESAYLMLQIGDYKGSLEKATKLMQFANSRQLFPNGFILKATSAALLNKDGSHLNTYESSVKDFIAVVKKEQEYVFASNMFAEYLYQHYPVALKHAKDWAMKATSFDDNYTNNYLLAQVCFKLDETTLAEETAKKAQDILRKLKGFETEKKQISDLLAQIVAKGSDKTPPALMITSPVASRGGVIVEDVNEIIVTGVARDESGISKVLINGNMAKLNPDGNFEGKTVLHGEQTKIVIQATDKRGNDGFETLIVENKKSTPTPTKENLAQVTTNGKNYAILFANNEYQNWGQLYNPINDAKALAKDLQTIYGFETEIVQNCTQEEFILKMREYIEKSYNDNDQLMIFYAGHGHFDETFKRGALVMKDSEYKAKTMKSYISYDELRSFISAIPCKHTLYVADACFSGTIDEKVARRGGKDDVMKNRQDFINRIMSYTTRLYITSGGKCYVPDGKPGGHSPFMRRMLEAMRSEGGNDGILTVAEIQSYLDGTNPIPLFGELDSNEPGSEFLFIKK
ncbi:MAG: hypothetical protein EAZ95_03500 [Bacteroidetes bacterium]|nr:MAG: hypothetical protein EAZ95_03500 [Bacteroidota bacterium]